MNASESRRDQPKVCAFPIFLQVLTGQDAVSRCTNQDSASLRSCRIVCMRGYRFTELTSTEFCSSLTEIVAQLRIINILKPYMRFGACVRGSERTRCM